MWPMAWLNGHGLGAIFEKLLIRKIWYRSLWMYLSEWAEKCEYIWYMDTPQRVVSAEEEFNNQVDRSTHSVDTY